MLVALREPAYLKLLGKAAGIGWGAGIARRLLPGPLADVALLLGGVALGLEMAAYVGDANDIYRDSIEARVTEAPALRGWVSSSADSRDELVEELENDAPPTPGG